MKTMIRTLLASAAIALPLAVTSGVSAQVQLPQAGGVQAPAAMPAFTHPQTVPADLARIDGSLNATESFSGRFAQYGQDGSYAQGVVHIQRPGKMRFEYDAPNPLLVVSDGVTLAYHDRDLDTTDRVPLSATPFDYFLKSDVNLANDTQVTSLQKLPNQWRLTARDGSGQTAGAITLVFDAQTLALMEWVIVDEFGGQTTVQFSDLEYNQRQDARLFRFTEDNDRRRGRRN